MRHIVFCCHSPRSSSSPNYPAKLPHKANYEESLLNLTRWLFSRKVCFVNESQEASSEDSYLCKIIRSHLYLKNYDIFSSLARIVSRSNQNKFPLLDEKRETFSWIILASDRVRGGRWNYKQYESLIKSQNLNKPFLVPCCKRAKTNIHFQLVAKYILFRQQHFCSSAENVSRWRRANIWRDN